MAGAGDAPSLSCLGHRQRDIGGNRADRWTGFCPESCDFCPQPRNGHLSSQHDPNHTYFHGGPDRNAGAEFSAHLGSQPGPRHTDLRSGPGCNAGTEFNTHLGSQPGPRHIDLRGGPGCNAGTEFNSNALPFTNSNGRSCNRGSQSNILAYAVIFTDCDRLSIAHSTSV